MIYIAGFALVFCGFCLGVIVAVLCACAGRADEAVGGYQPNKGNLDETNPPQGGSGVPEF